MTCVVSVPYATTLRVEGGASECVLNVVPRSSDWGVLGWRKLWHHLTEAVRILRASREYDVLVLCTVGVEAFVAAAFRPLLAPRTKIVVFDLLIPKQRGFVQWLVGRWIANCDEIVCIRTGDIATLQDRFGVSPARCRFFPFPADSSLAGTPTAEEGYVYSGGWAHRDWKTLIGAMSRLPWRSVFSAGVQLDVPSSMHDRVAILPMLSPEEGRRRMASASIVVLSMEDTKLPSGPLVLLDAMAMGKPIVVTNVNGTRDYVQDHETALVVPPGDVAAMGGAIDRLMQDREFAQQLGRNARRACAERFNAEAFAAAITDSCARCLNNVGR